MHNSTRSKYIAIGANFFVILLSLFILVALYLFSSDDINRRHHSISSSWPSESDTKHNLSLNNLDNHNTTSTTNNTIITTTDSTSNISSQSVRPQGAARQRESVGHQFESRTSLLGYLPTVIQEFINWLGKSVSSLEATTTTTTQYSSSATATTSSELFTAGQPLVAAAFLSYVLAIVGLIAIGLEHIALLITLVTIFALIFVSSLAVLVFVWLNSLLEHSTIILEFWSSLLIATVAISGLLFYVQLYLVYEIILERRVERSHEYCLAKMVPSVDDL